MCNSVFPCRLLSGGGNTKAAMRTLVALVISALPLVFIQAGESIALPLSGPRNAADYKADFSNKLDDGWIFVRQDKSQWRLRDGAVELLAQPSNIWARQNNDTKNLLLRPLPGDHFAVEVTVDFTPRKEYEQAGLIIYLDDDNYLKFDRELFAGQSCTLVLESGAKPKVVKKIPFREGRLRLRLAIAEGRVRAFVKTPEETQWTAHGETQLPGLVDKLKLGLFALGGDANAPRWARFTDFSMSRDE